MGDRKDHVQMRNPITQRFVKLDTRTGRIVHEKRTAGPYKDIPIRAQEGWGGV